MTGFVVSVQPIEQSRFLGIEPKRFGLFHKPFPLFGVIVWARSFNFIAPAPDFLGCLLLTGLIEPFRHLLIAGAIFDLRLEICSRHTFKTEQRVIERTIEMVFPDISCDQCPAFINGAAEDSVTANSDSRTSG